MTKRSGQRAQCNGDVETSEAEAELSRMISEVNELRMRLDSIVRKLATSSETVGESPDSLNDLQLRLLRKLDRIREQLVLRLSDL